MNALNKNMINFCNLRLQSESEPVWPDDGIKICTIFPILSVQKVAKSFSHEGSII